MIRDGVTDAKPVQKYDIRKPESDGCGFEERFWSPVNSPVFGPGAEVAYIIHRVEDVTEFVRLKEAGNTQRQLARELRSHADAMEAEVLQRTREVAEASRQLKEANAELAASLAKIKLAEEQMREVEALAERDCIAADLNNQIIRQLYALSLRVASLTPLAPGLIAERLEEVIRELDRVITSIRTTVFGLQQLSHPVGQREVIPASLRQQVASLATETGAQLGFVPQVGFEGLVDTLVTPAVAGEMMTVLRESLSNVLRHAQATAVEVTVTVRPELLILAVADDGTRPARMGAHRQRTTQHGHSSRRPGRALRHTGPHSPGGHPGMARPAPAQRRLTARPAVDYRRRRRLARCPGHGRRRKGRLPVPRHSYASLLLLTSFLARAGRGPTAPLGRDVRHCVAALPGRDGWERSSRRLADVPLIAPEEGDADGTGRVVGRVQDFRGPGRQLLLAAASRQRQDNRQIGPHLRKQVLVRAGRELAARKREPDHGVRPHQSRARIRILAVSCASWRRDSRSVGISQLSHGPAARSDSRPDPRPTPRAPCRSSATTSPAPRCRGAEPAR